MTRLKNLFILYIFLSNTLFAQQFSFGWLSDLHIGSPNAEVDLFAVVDDINNDSSIGFVIATGDIAEKGKNEELSKAKEILDNLKVPYYIIPGNHDTKWSESGGSQFVKLWGDDKFSFEKNSIRFIGMNSGIILRGGGGHISPEQLMWLDSILAVTPSSKEIYFFVHHPLSSDTDNWFEVSNRLRKKNIKAIFQGHEHANKILSYNGIPAAISRSTLSNKKSWGYTFVESKRDSIFFNEVTNDIKQKRWGTIAKNIELTIPEIDSTQAINFGVKVLWEKELFSTLVHAPILYKNKIFSVTKDGDIYCFDKSGKLVWQYNINGTILSRPAAENDILVIGTIEGDLISIDANTGRVIQIIGIPEPITSQLSIGTIPVGKEKYFGIIFGTANGKLYCYELNSLDLIWENSSSNGMIETKPAIVSDRIIFGSWDGWLYCVDLKTGLLNWRWSENQNFYYSPAAVVPVSDGKFVYVTTPDKFTSSIDILFGNTVWRKNDYNAWESIGLSTDKTKLFVKSMNDKFFVVNPKDGKKIKEINLKYGLDTTPNEIVDTKDYTVLAGKNGIVYQINNKFEAKPLLFAGTSRLLSPLKINDNTFLVSNMDGKLILFSIQKE